jgi:hypothetical protein
LSGKIYKQGDLEVGGEVVQTFIQDGYEGACSVFSFSSDELIACVSSVSEAYKIACYAISPDGGYGSVVVKPCKASKVTHNNFYEWAFG